MSWGSKTVVFEHQRNSYSISQKYTLSKLVKIAEQKGNFVQKHQWESLGCSPYCKIQTRTILCSFKLLEWRWCKIDKHMQENIHKQFICNYLDGFVCLSKPFIYINACELYMNWTLGKKVEINLFTPILNEIEKLQWPTGIWTWFQRFDRAIVFIKFLSTEAADAMLHFCV